MGQQEDLHALAQDEHKDQDEVKYVEYVHDSLADADLQADHKSQQLNDPAQRQDYEADSFNWHCFGREIDPSNYQLALLDSKASLALIECLDDKDRVGLFAEDDLLGEDGPCLAVYPPCFLQSRNLLRHSEWLLNFILDRADCCIGIQSKVKHLRVEIERCLRELALYGHHSARHLAHRVVWT